MEIVMPERDEQRGQQRLDRLLEGPYFLDVVKANRAYLLAAVADPAATELTGWVLSCLPSTRPAALSRVSMAWMETFTLLLPEAPTDGVTGFVIVSGEALQASLGSVEAVSASYPGLTVSASGYRDGGDDQIRVSGTASDLEAALGGEPIGEAARTLAERLLTRRTPYRSGHNRMLADHVLGRAE